MWLKDSTPTISNVHRFTAKLKRPKTFKSNLIIADFVHSINLEINSKIDINSNIDMELLYNIIIASQTDFNSMVNLVLITNLKVDTTKIDFSSYINLLVESFVESTSTLDFSSDINLMIMKNTATENSVLDFDSNTVINLYRFSRLKDFYRDNNGEFMNWMYGKTLNELSVTEIV